MSIQKIFKSETAHITRNVFSSRSKFNIHGHSYKWIIGLDGDIDQSNGMLIDFKLLKPIKDFVDKFDHSTVLWSKEENSVKEFFKNNFKRVIIMVRNPTAENMARALFKKTDDWLKTDFKYDKSKRTIFVSYAEVWETENSSARTSEADTFDIISFEESQINE